MNASSKRQRADSSAQSETFQSPSQQTPTHFGSFSLPDQQQQQMADEQQAFYASAFPAQQPNNFWSIPFPPQQYVWAYNGMPGQQPHFQHYGQLPFPQQQNLLAFMPPTLPPLGYYPPPPVPHGMTLPSDGRMVATLPETLLRELLIELVEADDTGFVRAGLVAGYLQEQQREQEQRNQQARVIRFDNYSKKAWHAINTKYPKRRESRWEASSEESRDVTREVVTCIKDIGKQVNIASSFETKLNALETLRKIAKSILFSNDTLGSIGHQVRTQFRSETVLVDTMESILETMSPGDRLLAGSSVSDVGKGTLLEKMKWFRADNMTSYVIEGLDVNNVCRELEGFDEDDDSEGGDENDEDDAEEDDADEDEQAEEDQGTVDVEECATKVDFIINRKYSSLGGSKQYEKSFDAFQEVQGQIKIVEKNAGPEVPFAARMCALRALVQIGHVVVGSEGDVVTHEVRKLFASDDTIAKLIRLIVKTFDLTQRRIAAEGHLVYLENLVEDAQSYGIHSFDDLTSVAALLVTNDE